MSEIQANEEKQVLSLRSCEIVIDKEHLSVDILKEIEKRKSICEYAFICHDQDKYNENDAPSADKIGTTKKAHYHIYLSFTCPWPVDNIAKAFGALPNNVNKIKGAKRDMLLYLLHKNAPEKHQYTLSDLTTNLDYEQATKKGAMLTFDFDAFSYQYYLNEIQNIIDTTTKRRNYKALRECWDIYINNLPNAYGNDRNIEIIYISGDTGCGKTTYAKKYAKERLGLSDFEIFVSGSSNDTLDGYTGQKCIILDDLRASSFSFSDLLKFLDKNTCSKVKSRFFNKDIRRCKTIIITSCKDIHYLYSSENIGESISQLYRRCSIWFRNREQTYIYDIFVYDDLTKDYVATNETIDITNLIVSLKNNKKQIDFAKFKL